MFDNMVQLNYTPTKGPQIRLDVSSEKERIRNQEPKTKLQGLHQVFFGEASTRYTRRNRLC